MTLHRRTVLTRAFGLGAGLLVGIPEIGRALEGIPVASPAPAVTPAADQLVWFLDRLNAGDLEETAVVDRFAPAYLALIASGAPVPTNDVVARVRRLAAELGPVVLQDFLAPPQQTPGVAYSLLAAGEGTFFMALTVEEAPPHRILDVLTAPLLTDALDGPPPAPVDWNAFDRQLAPYAPEVSVLAAELVDAAIHPIHTLNADLPLAVGSTYKLYILGELAQQIASGESSWDDSLAIRNDWKSLPAHPVNDPMAYEPAGTEHTLRQYAEAMIVVSGNTAADHLLLHLGRERVEAALAQMGHTRPELNRPLLATREFFALDVVLPAESVETYLQADEAERRDLLEAVVRPVDVAPVQAIDWVTPRHLEAVGWFASVADLGRAIASLRTMADEPDLSPILDILALNPGIDPSLLDPGTWPYIGHKGGALPGG